MQWLLISSQRNLLTCLLDLLIGWGMVLITNLAEWILIHLKKIAKMQVSQSSSLGLGFYKWIWREKEESETYVWSICEERFFWFEHCRVLLGLREKLKSAVVRFASPRWKITTASWILFGIVMRKLPLRMYWEVRWDVFGSLSRLDLKSWLSLSLYYSLRVFVFTYHEQIRCFIGGFYKFVRGASNAARVHTLQPKSAGKTRNIW